MSKKPLMSIDRVGELVHAALEEIVARDGSAPANEVLAGVTRRVHLTDVERSLNNSGIPRMLPLAPIFFLVPVEE